MSQESNLCINCGAQVVSKYCPQCAQPCPPRKINLVNLYYDFQSRVYGFDGMFPRTFRDLTLRPGIVAKEFIKGNRVKYYGPAGYFFLMVTVFLLTLSMTEVSFYDYMKTFSVTKIEPNSGSEKFMQIMSEWISKNMRIFSFLTIPINALTSKIFFRKSGLNVLEHSVLVFYTHGHVYWLSILAVIIFLILGFNPIGFTQLLASFILFGVGCTQLFDYQNKIKALIKGLLACFLTYLIFAILISISSLIYLYSNPEVLELIKQKN